MIYNYGGSILELYIESQQQIHSYVKLALPIQIYVVFVIYTDTLCHLLWECEYVENIWENVLI